MNVRWRRRFRLSLGPQYGRTGSADELRRRQIVDERSPPSSAAADGLQAQWAGARKQIDGVLPPTAGPTRLKTASRTRSFMGRVRGSTLYFSFRRRNSPPMIRTPIGGSAGFRLFPLRGRVVCVASWVLVPFPA